MKIVYITAQTPFGKGETFILEEMLEMKRQGVCLLIIPRNPLKEIFHKEAKSILPSTIWLPLLDFKIIKVFLKELISKSYTWKILIDIFRYSRNFSILIKNLIVLPKSIFICEVLRRENITHIHAHWGSTTATMAYVISKITGIPWSFTLHRWDIAENNMLKEKVRTAKFVRCISEHGRNKLLSIIGREYEEKIKVIHMGVEIPEEILQLYKNRNFFTIVTPANLLEVKGHKYLIEACEILVNRGFRNFQCIFYGEGPLREELENIIKDKNLTEFIKLPGAIPHEKLLNMYKNREIDIVILPSIKIDSGEHEGIPVALMEAMAYSIPVISTNTGGILELIGDGSGIMIEEKNSLALADAIEKLMKDDTFREELGKKGRLKVMREFNLEYIAKDLSKLFENRGE